MPGPTAADIVRKYNQTNSQKTVRTANDSAGRLGREAGTLVYHPPPNDSFSLLQGGAYCGVVQVAQIVEGMDAIEELAVPGEYRSVKSNPMWVHLYHGQPRSFQTVDTNGNPVPSLPILSFPCHYCGMVLPEDYIQVDHRQPNLHPAVAVLKTIHGMGFGFTIAPGKGVKSNMRQQIVANERAVKAINAAVATGASAASLAVPVATAAAAIVALPQIHPNAHVGVWRSGDLSMMPPKKNRYTITDAGKTFLSVCCMFWGDMAVEEKCLSSIVNLVPACSRCNGSAGKWWYTHAK